MCIQIKRDNATALRCNICIIVYIQLFLPFVPRTLSLIFLCSNFKLFIHPLITWSLSFNLWLCSAIEVWDNICPIIDDLHWCSSTAINLNCLPENRYLPIKIICHATKFAPPEFSLASHLDTTYYSSLSLACFGTPWGKILLRTLVPVFVTL